MYLATRGPVLPEKLRMGRKWFRATSYDWDLPVKDRSKEEGTRKALSNGICIARFGFLNTAGHVSSYYNWPALMYFPLVLLPFIQYFC